MKDLYRELCEKEPSIPLFSQAWWLDAVEGNGWDVAIAKKGKQIVGALPYVVRKKLGLRLITQPKLTQSLGPWIRPTEKSYPKRLSYEKEILGTLVEQLPSHAEYSQNWHCDRTNWLPFYWQGFSETTRYTYRLDISTEKEILWKGLQENTRREIRKSIDRVGVKVRKGTLDEFWELNKLTFDRQGRSMPYTRKFVERIDEAANKKGACDCLVAEGSDGRLHAGAYIVRGGNTAYYLMGGGDPELRSSGATSLVLWEAICSQPDEVDVFDFEGSMIEPIERFFRSFGAIQTPYFRVSKTSSRLLKAIKLAKELVK
ncbi:GNAT family N-acetyltransferase [Idiomarina abyssalis]|uniref:GNAT family N-acetyltransferase n=1 Tax=Idiomarina abyssalis TaxID=86102 RepID=UPI0023001D1E|nr:GNAT family N-acetyltransferase [Idiomarina abyssalis]MDA6067157.1 GNAT family N-acetyltransferase [Idiomarina abyssalis]